MVLARWNRKVPRTDFWCEESTVSCVTMEPGHCGGSDHEIMLCVANESGMEVAPERGASLAEAHEWVKPSWLDARPAAEMVMLSIEHHRELAPQQGDPAAAPELSVSEAGLLLNVADSVFGPSSFSGTGEGWELYSSEVALFELLAVSEAVE